MIFVKFSKKGGAAFLSHQEIMRCFSRTISRAGLPAGYSQGFNPHMLLYFSLPLPIGVESECELCCVDSTADPKEFAERFNMFSHPGIKITGAKFTETNINSAGITAAAKYIFRIPGLTEAALAEIMSEKQILLTVKEKQKDIRPLVYGLKREGGDYVSAIIAAGNTNLRADVLHKFLAEKSGKGGCGMDILRTNLYTYKDGCYEEIFG